jgi:hypothetical protein
MGVCASWDGEGDWIAKLLWLGSEDILLKDGKS